MLALESAQRLLALDLHVPLDLPLIVALRDTQIQEMISRQLQANCPETSGCLGAQPVSAKPAATLRTPHERQVKARMGRDCAAVSYENPAPISFSERVAGQAAHLQISVHQLEGGVVVPAVI